MPAGATADQSGSSPRIFRESELRHLLSREVQRSTRYQDFLSVCLVRPGSGDASPPDMQAGVARQIAEMLRSTDIVGTVGADIAVLLVHTPQTEAVLIAERIRQRIHAGGPSAAGESIPMAVSIGLASFPTDATSDAALLARAQSQLETTPRA